MKMFMGRCFFKRDDEALAPLRPSFFCQWLFSITNILILRSTRSECYKCYHDFSEFQKTIYYIYIYIYIHIYIYIYKFTKKCHRLPRPWSGDNHGIGNIFSSLQHPLLTSKLAYKRTYIYIYTYNIYIYMYIFKCNNHIYIYNQSKVK